MPTTTGAPGPTRARDPIAVVRDAVALWRDRLGPNLFGVACSGGADSIALADAAIAVFGAPHVVVLHVDHGLHAASAPIANDVAAWAKGQGAAAVVRRVEVARRASLEAAARDARYRALESLAAEIGSDWILLGHTARDQAETVLMRIVRGTGPAGLAGIPTIRGPFLRPLLALPREAIDAYVAARGLPTWNDPMNDDPAHQRVRVRTRILPLLRAENPAIDDALCRLASAAREWMGVIDELAEPIRRFPMDCARLAHVDPAVRKRAFALALEAAGLGYDARHLDAIDALAMRSAAGERAIDVPGGRVVRSYDTLEVRAAATDARPARPDHGAAAGPTGAYEVRPWRPGDRMKPARLRGRSRKLSDLYIDAKVPRALRRTARVVVRTRDQVIVWAEHLGFAHGEAGQDIPVPVRTGGSF